MKQKEELVQQAHNGTGLPEKRLQGEIDRTVFQLNFFAQFILDKNHLELIAEPAMSEREPQLKKALYKKNYPAGPVAVFGASNFPFAFSTAGGDTASALAAGCPVIAKAHPSLVGTNER